MDLLIYKALYAVSCILRWLFFTSRAGAIASNFILYYLAKMFSSKQKAYSESEYVGFTRVVGFALKGNAAAIALQKKFLNLTPIVKRRMMLFACIHLVGRRIRKRLLKKGWIVPYNVYLSPSYRCNLSCRSCYAAGRSGDLPIETIDRIVREQEVLGIYNVIITGGEPLLRDDLWLIYERYPYTAFSVFTNGTLLTKECVEKISRLGNVRLMVSLDGFREKTDNRRGEGVYDKAILALELCQQANIFYGVSVMVDRDNFDEVVSIAFIKRLVEAGAHAVIFPLCMPLGCGDFSLMPTLEQVEFLQTWSEYIKTRYPILPIIGKNGSSIVTACSAASQRVHITANGDVEPCVFCQWATDNISGGKSILQVMNSDFFQVIRYFNQSGETFLNPCKVGQSIFLQKAFDMAGAYPTAKNNK